MQRRAEEKVAGEAMADVQAGERFVVGVGEGIELAVLAWRGGELRAVVDGAGEGVASAELKAAGMETGFGVERVVRGVGVRDERADGAEGRGAARGVERKGEGLTWVETTHAVTALQDETGRSGRGRDVEVDGLGELRGDRHGVPGAEVEVVWGALERERCTLYGGKAEAVREDERRRGLDDGGGGIAVNAQG